MGGFKEGGQDSQGKTRKGIEEGYLLGFLYTLFVQADALFLTDVIEDRIEQKTTEASIFLISQFLKNLFKPFGNAKADHNHGSPYNIVEL